MPAKSPPALSQEQALELINSLPFLAAGSDRKLLRSMYSVRQYQGLRAGLKALLAKPILQVAFEVCNGSRRYQFPEQPFRVIRVITAGEYREVVPGGARFKWYYEIHTD